MKLPKIFEEKIGRFRATAFIVTNRVFDKSWKPYELVVEKMLSNEKLNANDCKVLQKLLTILKKGRGFTSETELTIKNELPSLFQRARDGRLSEADKKNLLELKSFLVFLKQDEKNRFLVSKKIL